MKLIPKKTFLLRQDRVDGQRPKDVIAHKGVAIEVSNEEAVKFAGYFELSEEKDKKKVVDAAKQNPSLKRMV